MKSTSDRRSFLSIGAAGVLAAALPGRQASAQEQVSDTSKLGAKFKFSLAAYSYRNLLTGKQPAMDLFGFVDDCAKMELEGTELTSYYFPTPVTPQYLRKLKAHCFRRGLDVSGTAVGNDFGHPEGEKRQQQIASLKAWIQQAEILGAPVIRVFAGKQQKDISEDETHRLIVSALEECCEFAGQHGVYLALENHGGPTATADGLMKLVDAVKSPWFGVNLDTGNFHTEDVYGDLARVAPRAINVQVKVVIHQDGKEEPMDYKRLANILRDSGYRGYVALEYEEKDDPRVVCPGFVRQMREAFES